jgi:hypothetical protein
VGVPSWKTDSIGVPDAQVTFLGSLSLFGTTYTDLGSEEIGSLHAAPTCYMPVSRVLAFTGQRTGL